MRRRATWGQRRSSRFAIRSEERRVGKECGSRVSPEYCEAEAGIRDIGVTGVQTCALPILPLVGAIVVSRKASHALRDTTMAPTKGTQFNSSMCGVMVWNCPANA